MRAGWMGLAALALWGCASAPPPASPDEAVLVKSTAAERAAVERERARLTAAEKERAEASAAIAEAQRFLGTASNELQFATRRLTLARAALRDGGPTPSAALLGEAAAEKAYGAAMAKRDYAWWMVDERRARFDEAEAERRLARADLDAVELDIAGRAHRAGGLSAGAIREEQRTAADALAAARARTQQRAGQVAEARDAWQVQQRQSDVAAREVERYEGQRQREQRP